jgi:hypothetical protein
MAIKGIELANELRKLADAVEGLEVVREFGKPTLYFGYAYGGEVSKKAFLEFAKVIPKPFEKRFSDNEFKLVYSSDALEVQAYIERNKVCTLITPAQPAVYDCEALLSLAEIAQLGSPVSESDEIDF